MAALGPRRWPFVAGGSIASALGSALVTNLLFRGSSPDLSNLPTILDAGAFWFAVAVVIYSVLYTVLYILRNTQATDNLVRILEARRRS